MAERELGVAKSANATMLATASQPALWNVVAPSAPQVAPDCSRLNLGDMVTWSGRHPAGVPLRYDARRAAPTWRGANPEPTLTPEAA